MVGPCLKVLKGKSVRGVPASCSGAPTCVRPQNHEDMRPRPAFLRGGDKESGFVVVVVVVFFHSIGERFITLCPKSCEWPLLFIFLGIRKPLKHGNKLF